METQNGPAPRTMLNLDVFFKRIYARSDTRGLLKNISLSGAFLEVPGEAIRANDKLHIRFKVGERERKIACHVIWSNSRGCGIKFLPVNNRDVQIVDDLIYFVENHKADKKDLLDDIFKKVG